jgi:putative tricarboxylic transport membrane protein
VSDRLSGLLCLVVGLTVALYARTFPPMPGQDIGPAMFPTLVGIGFAVFGVWLIGADLMGERGPLVTVESWVRRPRMVANVALVVAALVLYILLVEPVGFLLTSMAFLALLMAAFGAGRLVIVSVAVLVTLAMHYGFYSLLRVPLPWGVFERVAW